MSGSIDNIIKVGGSVITFKRDEGSFNRAAAGRIAAALPANTLIVHGSGSFGKPPAIRYGYLDGIVVRERLLPILEVRQALSRLNGLFVQELLANGIPAVGLSATSMFTHAGRDTECPGAALLGDLAGRGVVPVVYSDFIGYGADKLRVISSDQIVADLAAAFRPRNTLFATDVDGVLDDRDGGTVLPRVGTDFLELYGTAVKRSGSDVTGGMYDKIAHALKCARHSERCIVVNGHHPQRIARFCAGAPDVPGTRILFERCGRGARAPVAALD